MKILISAASYASNISGIQRHACNVVRCLLQQPEVSFVHLVIAPWQRKLVQDAGIKPDVRLSTHIAEMESGSLSRNSWHYWRLPELAARLEVDLVHLTYPVPVNAAAFICPTVVTLHDMYPYEIPRNFGFPKFIFNRLVLKQCLRNVDVIACVSDATRNRLEQYSSAPVWRKAIRIYNCVEAQPHCATQSPLPNWQGEPFLLCVAQHRHNKNLPLLIRTFDRLLRSGHAGSNLKLVIVGITAQDTRNIHRVVAALGLGASICFLEGLSEPELQWCYIRCEAVVAPSLTEGFGLPVAEALLAGCRIVCSDIPAHREIGDGRCRFVALGQDAENAFEEAIVEVLKEPKRAPVTLSQFSTPTLAKQYISLYRRIIYSTVPEENTCAPISINGATSERQPL
ncbi:MULTISPECIES: glycosyltransferase family 1 protein [Acidobacteriaceae]|uniref:glycosyltransferase family 4 protein n=1 Tax=Acidobacteriaceae TaxID=204434 RepID=UPI00131AFC9A|nr:MULTISPECIES: glycosyltransferase family 1 protein [Acidobacteriaceae]MDW5265152.1 glycosyltransferase family 1 protein [Edaphobacter sp.]